MQSTLGALTAFGSQAMGSPMAGQGQHPAPRAYCSSVQGKNLIKQTCKEQRSGWTVICWGILLGGASPQLKYNLLSRVAGQCQLPPRGRAREIGAATTMTRTVQAGPQLHRDEI